MPNPATYEIGVNWNDDGSTFANEQGNTKEFNTVIGRSDEFSAGEAGTATVILGNESGRFSPEYASGPLYGDLEPGRKIRLRATYAATPYNLFHGYITRIKPNPRTQECVLECEDMTRFLRAYRLNLADAADQRSDQRITAILDAVGIAGGERALATGQTTFPTSYWRNVDAYTAILECAYNELGGFVFVANDGKLTFQDRHYRPKHTLDATLTRFADLAYDRRDDQVYREVVLQAAGAIEGIAGSQIWSLVPLPQQLAAGDTLDLDVNYATGAKAVISPVSATDYAATANQDGSGADRTSDLSVESFADYSGGATWELKNNGATALWIQRAQIRGTPLELGSHLNTVRRTTAGGTAPFAASYTPPGFTLINSRVLLESYADYIINRYQTPQPLVHVTLQGATAAILTQMLTRGISDRVKIEDTGGVWQSWVNAEYFIERIEHRMAVNDESGERLFSTRWTLSDFLLDQFWALGTDTLGVSTVLGY